MQSLRWYQIQDQLTRHYHQTGKRYNFLQALHELHISSPINTQEESNTPVVPFMDWNPYDLDDLDNRLNQIPIPLVSALLAHSLADNPAESRMSRAINMLPMRIAHDQAMGLYAYDSFELIYVVRGRTLMLTETATRTLLPDTICLISAHTIHDVIVDPGSIVLSIAISEHTVEQTLLRLFRQHNLITDFFRSGLGRERGGYLLFPLHDYLPVRMFFRGMFHESYGVDRRTDFSADACANYLDLLLIHLLREGGELERHSSRLPAQQGVLPILAILRFIQTEWRTTSLEEIAAQFHFDRSYLSKQIKAHTGKTFTQLVSGLRMEEAKRLLQHTDQSVEQVAEACGYNSADHFSRSFLSAEGLRPSAWRKHMCTHARL